MVLQSWHSRRAKCIALQEKRIRKSTIQFFTFFHSIIQIAVRSLIYPNPCWLFVGTRVNRKKKTSSLRKDPFWWRFPKKTCYYGGPKNGCWGTNWRSSLFYDPRGFWKYLFIECAHLHCFYYLCIRILSMIIPIWLEFGADGISYERVNTRNCLDKKKRFQL